MSSTFGKERIRVPKPKPKQVEFQLFKERKSARPNVSTKVLRLLGLRPLGTLAGFHVFHVDCEKVRNHCDPDFCMGSHYAHSAFIPHGQIWVSNILHPTDLMPLLVHEAVETAWMTRNGWSYERAHDRATLFETALRKQVVKGGIKPKNAHEAMILAREATNKILSRP
jgi:hypothetical protein